MGYVVVISGFVATLTLWNFVSIYMVMATINYFTLLLGLTFRHTNKKLHGIIMSIAVLSDITLVFVLEFRYNVIAETVSLKLSPYNELHIFCSLMAILLYIPAVFLGLRLLKNENANQNLRLTHKKIGLSIAGFRTLGFFLMFSMRGLHI